MERMKPYGSMKARKRHEEKCVDDGGVSRKDRTRSSTDATTKMTTVFCNDFQKTLSRKSLM